MAINLQPCSESLVAAIQSLPLAEQARKIDARVREIERFHRMSYVELGELLAAMDSGSLHRYITDPATGEAFSSFDRWLSDAAPISRSTGYSAMRALRELREVPREQLLEIPKCNAEVLRKLPPKAKRDPAVIKAAQQFTEEAFIGYVQREVPEAHIERTQRMQLRPEKSARQVIDQAIAVMCWLTETGSRESALEAIAVAWLHSPCEREEFAGMSNLEAYESRRGN